MKKVIVIGSGIGGLIAANLLAKGGKDVSLYESHHTPGGYTGGFWRNGFYFENGTFSLEDSSIVFKTLQNLNVFDKVTFVPIKSRWVSPDFDGNPNSYEEFKQLLVTAYPQDNWPSYFKKVDRMYRAFSGKSFWEKWRSLYYILKYKNLSSPQFAQQFFSKNSSSYNLAKSLVFCGTDAPVWMIALTLRALFQDYWVVRDGMQSLADTLTYNLQKLGGELHLESAVEKIVTLEGKVCGIMCKGQFEEADAVVAACDYKETFLKLLDDTTKIDVEKIQKADVCESAFTVYLGLKISNEELQNHLKKPVVFLNENSLYSPSLMNPRLAPEGKSSLMIYTPMHAWKSLSREEYSAKKNNFKEKLIQCASTLIPQLKERIEMEDAATPRTYEKYTQNAEGSMCGWSWDVGKDFHQGKGRIHIETPIKNLYIGSCWAASFGGVPGAVMAGSAAAKKILK